MTVLMSDSREGHDSDVEDSYVCVSFRDLPTATQQLGLERLPSLPGLPSSGDSFEFFSGDLSDGGGELCSAADIFSQGKLLPFRRHDAPPPAKAPPLEHWRSSSLGAIRQRSGRLAEENSMLRRASSDPSPPVTPRLPPGSPSWTPSSASPTRRPLPALWTSMMKPAAMEVRDIRCLQKRRQARASPTASEKGGSEWWREGKSGPWKILRALSCSGTESSAVVVPAPAGLVHRVRA